jgi:hypothetical protein
MNNKTKKNKIYTKEDFNSSEGMLTAVWGPAMWHFLHTMSFNYPVNPTKEEKNNYMNFVKNLVFVLPCKYCRMNLKENFKQKPLNIDKMKSRDSFSRYIYDLHEHVNKMLKKKSGLTYEDVQERYEHFRARCLANQPQPKESKGCTEPLFGKKSKCLIQIVPIDNNKPTFAINKQCIRTRKYKK